MAKRRYIRLSRLTLSLLLAILASSATAQTQYVPYTTGTGFYVGRQGHVVTNAHVLDQCVDIMLIGESNSRFPATVVTKDDKLDLAVLKSKKLPSRISYLRHKFTGIRPDEKVVVMGYPEDYAGTGRYKIEYANVEDIKGPHGESQFLQFSDSARHGNSGGPLLDYAGNVVGVVTAKVDLLEVNRLTRKQKIVARRDIAISIPVLRAFLTKHRIPYETRDSLLKLSKYNIEQYGKQFIVNVLCRQEPE